MTSSRRPIIVVLALAVTAATGAQTPSTDAWRGVDLKGMDTTAKACQDFYQYANGNWLKDNPIPADRSSWGTGSMVSERNLAVLHQILEDAAKNTTAPKGTPAQLVGDFYRSGMDEARIAADGTTPLAPELARIDAIKDTPSFQDEVAHLHALNMSPVFVFAVNQDLKDSSKQIAWLYQGGLGLPDRDYYVKDDDQTKEIRSAYVKHVAAMFALLGDAADKAAAEANTVMSLETRLAKASMTVVEQRDPTAVDHPTKFADLTSVAPGPAWARYFTSIGLAQPDVINVGQPAFFKEVGTMWDEVSIAEWKTYLRWQLIDAQASRLSDPFVNENFDFNGRVMTGTTELRPRWKRVLQSTDQEIGEALGQLYVAKVFTPEAKARALAMVTNLKAALRDRIQALDWISDTTRQQALRKLDAMTIKIGYPDKWRDYSSLDVSSPSYVTNAMAADAFEFKRNLRKAGRPVDRTEWGMTPPTVDAYNNAQFNEIVFPAGILQLPFFDETADDASNYGAMGAIIGHELTHGFDDQGRQFDAQGNLKDWWTPEDAKAFEARGSLMTDEYNAYVGVDDMHVNGKLTLGENIADLGGLKIAYAALQKALAGKPRPAPVDGFTVEQRFFLAFAEAWRRNTKPEAVRLQLSTDPHSPPRFRVVGPVSNMPEFAAAFSCREGDPMVRPESARTKIW